MNLQVNWVKHTVADTSWYAVAMRARSGIPQTSVDSVIAVADESVCADLAAQFARIATARDTVNPAPVYVVKVRPSHYMVTDGKPENPPPTGLAPPDTQIIRTADGWAEAVTFAISPATSQLWKWVYSAAMRMPY